MHSEFFFAKFWKKYVQNIRVYMVSCFRSSIIAAVEDGSSYPVPSDCEVQSVIKVLNAHSIAPIEIHCHLCQVNGPNVMTKQMVHCWCRQFTAGQQHVHDEEHSGRLSLITDDLVELMQLCIMENCRFTFTELTIISRRFHNDREVEMSVTQWFQSHAADFYYTGMQKLVPRYDKCLNSGGEYVKK